MKLEKRRRITICTEHALQEQLVESLATWGAQEVCVIEGRGWLPHAPTPPACITTLVHIEAVADEEHTAHILEELQSPHRAASIFELFVTDVYVHPVVKPHAEPQGDTSQTRELVWGDYLITI